MPVVYALDPSISLKRCPDFVTRARTLQIGDIGHKKWEKGKLMRSYQKGEITEMR